MHEEREDHKQDRQCAKANHCNSKTDIRQENAPVAKIWREQWCLSSPVTVLAEGDAVMIKFILFRAAPAIRHRRVAGF